LTTTNLIKKGFYNFDFLKMYPEQEAVQ